MLRSGGDSGLYLLSAAVLGLLAGSAYLALKVSDLDREAAAVRQAVVAEVSRLREAALVTGDADHQQLEQLRAELEAARMQAVAAAGEAKREAQQRADELARQLRQATRRQQEQVAGELTNLRAVAVAAHAAIGDVDGELNERKEEIAAARSGIEQAATAGSGASAGLAGFSEYLAAHGRELAAMRRRRQLNYYRFALAKSAAPQTVGGIPLRLRKADPRQNTYTLEVIFTGRTLEQKDRSLNEPVRFYVSDARQPCELVVNEIGKDEVRGYLAAPKETQIATN